jgi:hypothetical protein
MNKERIKTIEEQIEELYNTIMEKPLRVLEIFNDFFGEDRIDMQGYWNLDKFKAWINIEPIQTYISENASQLSREDWSTYKTEAIVDLPSNHATNILSNITQNTIDFIGTHKFNSMYILVHFPQVRVTNEHDRFVDITNLWAKVCICSNGSMRGNFSLNRSSYPLLHFSSNYMHSHVSSIPTSDFTMFQVPCFGSGPVRDTMTSLNREFDEDLWNMFCLELSKYVTVESISGTPYNYLERLGSRNMITGVDKFYTYLTRRSSVIGDDKFREFVKHFINLKKLKFNYVNGSYSIGMSLIEYIVLVSNEFIAWYNDQFNKGELPYTFERLKRNEFLKECVINNGKIYYERDVENINRYTQYIGKRVCIFKGREINLEITDVAELVNENKTVILDTQNALYILATILKVLNYRYGRSKAVSESTESGTEVRYL